MGGFYRSALIVLLELGPILLLLVAVAVLVRRQARPALQAHAVWREQKRLLEAEVVRLSHATGELDALVQAQGELEALTIVEPERPWWSRR